MATGVFKFVWSLAGANYKITNTEHACGVGSGADQVKNLILKNDPVYKTLPWTINLHLFRFYISVRRRSGLVPVPIWSGSDAVPDSIQFCSNFIFYDFLLIRSSFLLIIITSVLWGSVAQLII